MNKAIKIHNVGSGKWDSVILHEMRWPDPSGYIPGEKHGVTSRTTLVREYWAPQIMGHRIFIYHVRHKHYVVRTTYGLPRGIHLTLESAINMVKRQIYGHQQACMDFYNTFPHAVWGNEPVVPHGTLEPWFATLPQKHIPAKNGCGERTHTQIPKWCYLHGGTTWL